MSAETLDVPYFAQKAVQEVRDDYRLAQNVTDRHIYRAILNLLDEKAYDQAIAGLLADLDLPLVPLIFVEKIHPAKDTSLLCTISVHGVVLARHSLRYIAYDEFIVHYRTNAFSAIKHLIAAFGEPTFVFGQNYLAN